MTDPTKTPSAPTPDGKPRKGETLTNTVFVATGDFQATGVHDDEARDLFRAHHDGVSLGDVTIVGKRHDIGHGITYDLSATVK